MATITAGDIAQGLSKREFVPHYQPKTSLFTSRIVGAEALARWCRPDGTVLPPASFIAIAEKAGLLKDLTRQLLPQLVNDLVDSGLDNGLCISLNVTAQDFEDDTLNDAIFAAFAQRQLLARSLELEITETQALEAGEHVLRRVQALADAGIGLAMDDYGIGYSSMDTLSRWPFTTIKLDQGIVGRMLASGKNATIVRSSIRLGHELGLDVVAEGVEDIAQHDFLVEAGCKLMQGFLVSPALPLEQFQAFRNRAFQLRGFPIGLVHMAIFDHVLWRRQMVSYALQRAALPGASPARQAEGYPPLCLTECALGKWYLGEGRYFAATAMYKALDTPHRALHRVGGDIVGQVRAGATLRDLAPLLQELKAVSSELLRLLEELEDLGLHALYGHAALAGDEPH